LSRSCSSFTRSRSASRLLTPSASLDPTSCHRIAVTFDHGPPEAPADDRPHELGSRASSRDQTELKAVGTNRRRPNLIVGSFLQPQLDTWRHDRAPAASARSAVMAGGRLWRSSRFCHPLRTLCAAGVRPFAVGFASPPTRRSSGTEILTSSLSAVYQGRHTRY
jgi:hypothetical protein